MSSSEQTTVAQLIDWHGTWFKEENCLRAGEMSGRLFPYDHIFSPIRINKIEIANRIVMGPMGNVSMADETGRPSAKMIAYFEERARGGVGLITSGLVPVAPELDPSTAERGSLTFLPRINGSRSVSAGWRDLVQAIHAHGARFFVQLTAGLGRVGSPQCVSNRWRLPVSSSWNPNFYVSQIPCRPLFDFECRRIIQAAGQAAIDARGYGIDGVYLHGHEGYLLEQFANPAFNRRKMGRYADWRAFGIDMVTQIRRRCGPDYPIMYRIDVSLALRETYGDRMNHVPRLRKFRDERTVAETLNYIRNLVDAGVDIVDVDLGCYENWWLPHPPNAMPPGSFLEAAKLVKRFLDGNGIRSKAGCSVPVVAVGKLGYPDTAERALRDGFCDMIMLARPLLADPQWARKAYAGRIREITPCIGDQEGCVNEFIQGGHLQCAVNPRTGFEERSPAVPQRTMKSKRIAVIGAGPAGITSACLAAERGHDVVLFEKASRVGGWLRAGSVPKIKFDVANYLLHLEDRLERVSRDYPLDVRLSVEIAPQDLADDKFDSVVCCTGSTPVLPPVEGHSLPHVVSAADLLLRPALAAPADSIMIIGGGDVGCETAHMLAYELGKKVTVVEMSPYFMKATCTANRGYLIHYLERKGVLLWNCTRVERIKSGAVEIVRNVSPTVPSPSAVWEPIIPESMRNPFARSIKIEESRATLAIDLVVFATGLKSNDALYRACVDAHVAPEIQNIGDSFNPGRIFEATKAGYAVGLAL
jgi:2-enoate reductase